MHWLKTSHHCSVTFWPAKINRRLRYQAHHRYQPVQLHHSSTWVTRRTSPHCCRPRKLQRCRPRKLQPLEVPCLPKKLEDQISKGEFVDFSLLLPGNSDHPSFAPIRLSLEGDQGFSIPLPNFSNFGKRPKIDSLDKWLTAFGIYASVVVAKFPHKASQLFAYQRIIREAAQKFKGLACYPYDVEFRKLAAKNPALNWGERHLQLWLDKFTGLAHSVCFVCGSADHLSDLCPLSSPRPDSKRTSFPSQRGLCRGNRMRSQTVSFRTPLQSRRLWWTAWRL